MDMPSEEQMLERGKKEFQQDERRKKFNSRRRIYIQNMEEFAKEKGWNVQEQKDIAHEEAFK